jgi:hypothetical protein
VSHHPGPACPRDGCTLTSPELQHARRELAAALALALARADSPGPPMVPIAALGVLTIIGCGACYYAYGVLIGPISADTRWPDEALGATGCYTPAITIISPGFAAAAGMLLLGR